MMFHFKETFLSHFSVSSEFSGGIIIDNSLSIAILLNYFRTSILPVLLIGTTGGRLRQTWREVAQARKVSR